MSKGKWKVKFKLTPAHTIGTRIICDSYTIKDKSGKNVNIPISKEEAIERASGRYKRSAMYLDYEVIDVEFVED